MGRIAVRLACRETIADDATAGYDEIIVIDAWKEKKKRGANRVAFTTVERRKQQNGKSRFRGVRDTNSRLPNLVLFKMWYCTYLAKSFLVSLFMGIILEI